MRPSDAILLSDGKPLLLLLDKCHLHECGLSPVIGNSRINLHLMLDNINVGSYALFDFILSTLCLSVEMIYFTAEKYLVDHLKSLFSYDNIKDINIH